MEIIIDGKNMILGRAATQIAKQLIDGSSVHVINAEQMIITGDPMSIKEKYLERRRRGSPQHGPFFPIRPDLLVRRTVRGMLPYKTNKGRQAFKNLRTYIGNPNNASAGIDEKKIISLRTKYMTVGKLSEALGWKGK